MIPRNFEIAVILSAVDGMSRAIGDAVRKSASHLQNFSKRADQFSNKANSAGRSMGTIGVAAMAPAGLAIKKFAEFESSELNLKATMLEAGGKINKNFAAINQLAIDLGTELKGNTSDFQNMFNTMLSGGVSAESILNGVGKSASYMANVLDVNYDMAGAFASKIREAGGVGDQEMMGMLDTLTRITKVMPGGDSATKITELQEAFARSGGQLKNFGLQGLESSKQVATLYAELIRSGAHGETVGTGFSKILESFYNKKQMSEFNAAASNLGLKFDFIDKKTGAFKGIQNMVEQFDKMKHLSTSQRTDLITALVGDGQDSNFIKVFANLGIDGYNAMTEAIHKQATLEERKNLITGGLANQWDAALGNMENTLANFGKTMKPVLIPLINNLNTFIAKVNSFIEAHPGATATIGKMMLGFGALLTVMSGVSFFIGGFARILGTGSSLLSFGARLFGRNPAAAEKAAEAAAKTVVRGFASKATAAGAKAAGAGVEVAANAAKFSKLAKVGGVLRTVGKWAGPISFLLETSSEDMSERAVAARSALAAKRRAEYEKTYEGRMGNTQARISDLKLIQGVLQGKGVEAIKNSVNADEWFAGPNAGIRNAKNLLDRLRNNPNMLRDLGVATKPAQTVHYAPVIHMSGNATTQDIKKLLKENVDYLMRLLTEENRKAGRTKFSMG